MYELHCVIFREWAVICFRVAALQADKFREMLKVILIGVAVIVENSNGVIEHYAFVTLPLKIKVKILL